MDNHSHIYLVINDTWAHRCTLQYCKVRWCGLYHLLVGICANGYPFMGPIYHLSLGICANGYPFSHIPSDK